MNNLNFQIVAIKLVFGALYYQLAPLSFHQGAIGRQISIYAMSIIATAAAIATQSDDVTWKIEAVLPIVFIGIVTIFQNVSWKVYLLGTAILGGVQALIDFTIHSYRQGNLLSFIPSMRSTETLWVKGSDGSMRLNKHPMLCFDDRWVLTKGSGGKLEGTLTGSTDPQFSLEKGEVFLCEGQSPSIQFTCSVVDSLIKSGAIVTTDLHTSRKGTVNLSEKLRENFHLPENVTTSCLCYPAFLDPDRAEATIQEIRADKSIPSFMAGLLLYGGFAFFDMHGELVTVKALTELETSTETLPMGKTIGEDQLPGQLRRRFQEGINMTNGEGEWALYKGGILSTAANKVAMPTLQQHLTHYTYLPPDEYAYSTLEGIAPFGALVYRGKNGAFQIVPIGSSSGSISTRKEVKLKEDEENKLRLILKLILENPMQLYQSFTPNVEEFFTLTYEGLEFEEKRYFAKGNQILIREEHTSHAITLDENGKITEVKTTEHGGIFSSDKEETFNADKVPTELVEDLHTVFEKLMSSCYAIEPRANEVLFYLTKEGPEYAPLNYLRLLTSVILAGKIPQTRIFDLVEGKFIGQDVEGLTRTFISHLTKGIVRSSHFYNKDDIGFFPFQKGSLTTRDRAFFEQVGTLFAFCRMSNGKYVTGQFFNKTLFSTLQAFTTTELESKNLPPLSSDRKLKLYKTMIGNESGYKQLLEILNSNASPTVEDELLEVYVEECLPEPKPKMEEVRANWKTQWREQLLQGFFKSCETQGGYSFEAVHAIGHALGQISGYVLSSARLSDRIQGAIDPKAVAEAITYSGRHESVARKVGWLKAWVKSTSRGDVEQFLEFVSGTRGLPPGQLITIKEHSTNSPFLNASTCFWSILIPYGEVDEAGQHETKELFIKRVEESIKDCGYGRA